jgi:hypothetical protein
MSACTCIPISHGPEKVHDANCLLKQRQSARIVKVTVEDTVAPKTRVQSAQPQPPPAAAATPAPKPPPQPTQPVDAAAAEKPEVRK